MPINEQGWEVNEAGNLTAYPLLSSRSATVAEDWICLQLAVATDAQAPQTVGARYQVILSPAEARIIAKRLLERADQIERQPPPVQH
jgi:hypothetical protein